MKNKVTTQLEEMKAEITRFDEFVTAKLTIFNAVLPNVKSLLKKYGATEFDIEVLRVSKSAFDEGVIYFVIRINCDLQNVSHRRLENLRKKLGMYIPIGTGVRETGISFIYQSDK